MIFSISVVVFVCICILLATAFVLAFLYHTAALLNLIEIVALCSFKLIRFIQIKLLLLYLCVFLAHLLKSKT